VSIPTFCVVCGQPSQGSRCEMHRLRNGSSRTWRGVRQRVLIRDRYSCRVPGPDGEPCGALATHVDHVIPLADGGTDDESNLRAACPPCNLSRGAR
jgi:5-methylcytosine-specific restriction endonuclease McrA